MLSEQILKQQMCKSVKSIIRSLFSTKKDKHWKIENRLINTFIAKELTARLKKVELVSTEQKLNGHPTKINGIIEEKIVWLKLRASLLLFNFSSLEWFWFKSDNAISTLFCLGQFGRVSISKSMSLTEQGSVSLVISKQGLQNFVCLSNVRMPNIQMFNRCQSAESTMPTTTKDFETVHKGRFFLN